MLSLEIGGTVPQQYNVAVTGMSLVQDLHLGRCYGGRWICIFINFSVTGNFVQNGGRFIGSECGSGNINITVNGILDMNAGTFRAS